MPRLGFQALEDKLAARPGVTDPAALAATIGRRKYGMKAMEQKSAAGRRKAAKKRAARKTRKATKGRSR